MPAQAQITSLKFKASSIAAAEARFNMDFFGALDKIGSSMSAMLFLFCAGGGDQDSFDKFMEEKGVKEMVLLIMSGINDAGFLGIKLDLNKVRAKMEEAYSEAVNTVTSQNTGEAANA